MWSPDSLLGKAQVYFNRAREHNALDDEFLIWNVLGLEFLLRLPLASINKTLLAAPEGDSILAASGVVVSGPVKSIPSHTVVSRLQKIIPEFTKERADDTNFLLNIRNAELHTGEAAASVPDHVWLPKLIRVVETIASHLSMDMGDLLGADTVSHGRRLVDEEDKKLAHRIQKLISDAKDAFLARPREEQIQAIAAGASPFHSTAAPCPACGTYVGMEAEEVRRAAPRLEDDNLVTDVVMIATRFKCDVCGLALESTSEIHAAGIEQQFHIVESDDLYENYQESFYEDGYGND